MSRDIQTALCSPDERCLSPLCIGFFGLPLAVILFGVTRLDPRIIITGLGMTAGLLATAPRLLRGDLAERADERFARSRMVADFAARRRRRMRRLERRWGHVACTVAILDLIFAYAVVRAVVNPVGDAPARPGEAVALLIGLGLALSALGGSAWVAAAWFELRDHRRAPKKWSTDPVVRSREIAVRLDGEPTLWLTCGLSVLVGICTVVILTFG